ncbi:MAG: transposase [Ktedonobacteraceae bacterium]|nr:transposase [Ktedonobacteraceae bacterium]
MFLSHPLLKVLAPFRSAFTDPSWKNVLVLVEGTLLAHGRRTVTAALRMMGLSENAHFNVFHHTLSRAHWSAFRLSRMLLLLLVQTFVPPNAMVEMVVDETLERRWGPHIHKCAYYHDPVRSSQKYRKISRGLKWLCLMLLITPPWTSQTWALPFLCVLLSSEKVDTKLGRRHKTVPEWTRQLVKVVHRWLPNRPIKLIGDGAYSVVELGLVCRKQQATLIAPLRFDACLYTPPPTRHSRQEGRPRGIGTRLPQMDQVLDDATIPWQKACVTWYGQGKQHLEYCSGTALWYRGGHVPLPVRWVLTRDPQGEREARAYFSTDQTQSGLSIVTDFMKRWSAEVTFEESRAHLGIETQRQWSDLAIERTTPCLFGLYSLIALLGQNLYPNGNVPLQQAAWYRKQKVTFSDVFIAVRQHLWEDFHYVTSPENPDVILLTRSALARLTYAACSSA